MKYFHAEFSLKAKKEKQHKIRFEEGKIRKWEKTQKFPHKHIHRRKTSYKLKFSLLFSLNENVLGTSKKKKGRKKYRA